MANLTTLKQLEDRHDRTNVALVSKQLNCQKWRVNPNDVLWLFHDPQFDKQLGRSMCTYHRLANL